MLEDARPVKSLQVLCLARVGASGDRKRPMLAANPAVILRSCIVVVYIARRNSKIKGVDNLFCVIGRLGKVVADPLKSEKLSLTPIIHFS